MKKVILSACCLLLTSTFASVGEERTRVPDFLILGGELGNSSAACKEDIAGIFPKLKEMGLNTVLMPVYWEMTEPSEGKYDFSLLDEAIVKARENDLKLVLLWFGAWKNSMSCYAPAWVKTDAKRFPRAITESGKPLEILSAFSEEVLKADLKAFSAMLDHLKFNDPDNTVCMIQIENEIGMLESARDHSPLADMAYSKGVPEPLAELLNVKPWSPWRNLAEDEDYADEMFMAWHYARYVEYLAQAARTKLPSVPVYVNAALDSRGRRPGQYPSAGPIARLGNIWKAAAPSIDFISPDLYDAPFAPW
ncbi:MAG: beta-galactosidase, partial [Muribaculaceae bacterium]|nr:beta-galactosidase [Muribaculaceae bacterium]